MSGTDTFEVAWTRAGLPEAAGVTSTLQRHLSGPSIDPSLLPALSVGAGGDDPLRELECLGEGGMGIVHAAHDAVLDRTVAVKRPKRGRVGRAATTLVVEARTLAGLDHPNVVPVHALGRDADGGPVLVMKRVTGQRWSDVARGGADLERDIGILLEVCDAVRFAHARGILHRDLKPDNVMVGEFGEVYVMDWGCACRIADAVTTEVVGTPAMMAPEMLAVGAPIGTATDVYLLGATLHQVVVGAPRHPGRDLREVMEHAFRSPPASWPAEVPAELAAIIDRACARDPEDRHPTVEAFAAALRGFLGHRQAAALARRASERLAELDAAIEAGDPRCEAIFAEVRFGFRNALEGWPWCVEAVEGAARAYAAFLPWKLASADLAAVAALVEELPESDAAPWRTRLEAARRARADAEQALRDSDLTSSARSRRNATVTLLAATVLIVVGVGVVKPNQDFTPATLVRLAVGAVVVAILVMLPFRKKALGNRAARMTMGGLFVVVGVSLLNRVVAWWADAPVDSTLRADAWIAGTSFLFLGLTWLRSAALGALAFFGAAAAMAARPDLAPALFPAALVVAFALTAVLGWRETTRSDNIRA